MSSIPRGIATLALLKTRFDEGRDHLGLLEPFVAESIAQFAGDSFTASDILGGLSSSIGLKIPVDAVQTVLGRFTRKGFLRREGGRFLKVSLPDPLADNGARKVVETDFEALGEALQEHASGAGEPIATLGEALEAISAFISDNKIPLLLQTPIPESPLERSTLPRKLARTLSRFILERCMKPGKLRDALEAMLEGVVLRDALLLRDIANLQQRFQGLMVLIDTQMVFAALDLTGIANGIATREGLTLLREAGARVTVLDKTIAEVRRILAVYEDKLATSAGRMSLYQTDLTHTVLSTKQTPGDIRILSAMLERKLKDLTIHVCASPERIPQYTLDEPALALALADVRTGASDTPRIRHDVDCVASVLTMRAGQTTPSMEQSKAVFCSTSGRVIRNVQQWYLAQGQHGAPPIIHQYALTSIAWMKKPTAVPGFKLYELAAVCSAVLQPSRSTWDKFIDNLRKLIADKTLSSEESVAIVASELTEPLLARIDEESDPDADTIAETIERVVHSYRSEAEASAREVVDKANAEVELAKKSESDAVSRARMLYAAMLKRSLGVASVLSTAIFYALCLVAVLSAVLSLPGTSEALPGRWQWFARGVLFLSLIVGVYSQIHGPSIADMRRSLRTSLCKMSFRLLYGRERLDDYGAICGESLDESVTREACQK